MSEHFPIIFGVGCVLITFTVLVERFRLGPLWILLFTWYVPVLVSQDTGLIYNRSWGSVTLWASLLVLAGFLIGYMLTFSLVGRISAPTKMSWSKLCRLESMCLFFGAGVIFAYLLLFYLIGGPPLLSSDVGASRVSLTSHSPVLYSVTQLSNLVGCGFGILFCHKRVSKFVLLIWLAIFFLQILGAWRGMILTYLLFSSVPLLVFYRLDLSRSLASGILFLLLFSIIGFARGDQGGSSGFSFTGAAQLILLYVYPAFLNFESVLMYPDSGFHLYTLQFLLKPVLQLFGASVTPPQSAIGAFNVSTGLSPLYADGGLVNIFFVFLVMGSALRLFLVKGQKGVITCFIIATVYSTLTFLHNGWFLLNFMVSYSIIGYLLFCAVYQLLLHLRPKGARPR